MKKTILMVFLLGAAVLSAQKSYKATTESTATPTQSWEMITDVNQWKSWDSNVVDVKYEGPIREKGVGRIINPEGKIMEFKITEVEDGVSYTYKHKLSSGVMYTKRSISSVATGSVITEEVWFKGLSPKTFKKYYGEDYTATIQGNLTTLGNLVK
ncbi:MAG: SRPBCC family protein [Bacteroidota bacterium]